MNRHRKGYIFLIKVILPIEVPSFRGLLGSSQTKLLRELTMVYSTVRLCSQR